MLTSNNVNYIDTTTSQLSNPTVIFFIAHFYFDFSNERGFISYGFIFSAHPVQFSVFCVSTSFSVTFFAFFATFTRIRISHRGIINEQILIQTQVLGTLLDIGQDNCP